MPNGHDAALTVLAPDEPDYAKAADLDFQAIEAISDLAAGASPSLASKAVFLASLVDDALATSVVLRAAASRDDGLRTSAAAAARHLPVEPATDLLRSLLKDPRDRVRKTAIESAGMLATDQLRQLLEAVSKTDPLTELRERSKSIVQRIGSGPVGDFQRQINDVTRRAKRRPYARSRAESVLTNADIDFLDTLYDRIALAGRIVAPEASQLLRRYRSPSQTGVEKVPSDIYEDSPRVQAEMGWHRDRIREAAASGHVPVKGSDRRFAVNDAARISEACSPPRSAKKPTRMLLADGDRLKRANNRFYLQSYSVRVAEGDTFDTEFVVTDCYAFRPFRAKLYTEFEVLGLRLRLEDGLGEYLTRIGKARVFTYESSWTSTWKR